MHLRSLNLKGFKSFPDRTRLEFSPGVSVVVGPNGSGKSNITDAVLWALGEQSPLAVRGQSMQDVIFAGGHGVQARGEAEVEVVLDNADGAIDLPAGEVSIARRLNRAGEGEYRVNGARCRLVDVLELLSDTGLGKEMHSVVSQGRVEAIVTSKPRDRRLLIEEAAGLGKHRKRRRRAQLKLDRTQDNLDRALDVEREARTRLRPLKRQAEAAELHERLERQSAEARWELARDARPRRRRGAGRRRGRGPRGARGCGRDRARAARGRRAPRGGRAGARHARQRARGAVEPHLRRALGGREGRPAARGRARRDRHAWTSAPPAGARCWRSWAPRPPPMPRTPAPPNGSPRCARSSSSSPPTARSGSSASSPSSRPAARRRPRRRRAARPPPRRPGSAPAPPRPPPSRPARPAASARRRPSAPVASPPAWAPSSRPSTSSCAPRPAHREAHPRWATRCGPTPGTSSPWPPRSARACAPRSPPISTPPPRSWTAAAATEGPPWWRRARPTRPLRPPPVGPLPTGPIRPPPTRPLRRRPTQPPFH